jgi:hypothetical protein
MATVAGAYESQSLSPEPKDPLPALVPETDMSRHFKTARARITNRGPLPRFIGLIPTDKASDGVIPFSSLSELTVALFLIWAKSVNAIAYEPRVVTFQATDDLPEITGWPDFEAVLEGGEIDWVNAKYSESSMREDERARLETFDAHCRVNGHRHRVIFRDQLEKDGFIETIGLLRPFGMLNYREGDLDGAMSILGTLPPTHLEGWEARARDALLPLDLVYYLLYHQRLPLLYRPLIHRSLRKCRV